jgi:predicted dehydrogenase
VSAGPRVRWGILGAGGIAHTVGADIAASPASVVAAVASRDASRSASLAAALGAGRAYGSYEALVADPDVDVVYVATTHAQHHAAALLALRAGKPVLVEKPIGVNAREAREIAAVAAAKGLLCLEGMWLRLNPTAVAVWAAVAAGEIGDVVAVRADVSHRFDYDPGHRMFDPALGGGALLDLGVYAAAFVLPLIGRPVNVRASGTLAPTGVDASAVVTWTSATGRVAALTCSSTTEGGSGATIVGTAGWIEVAGPLFRTEAFTISTTTGSRTEARLLPPGNGYSLEVAEIERCLAAGEIVSRLMPLADSVAVLEALDEARRQLGVRYQADEEN